MRAIATTICLAIGVTGMTGTAYATHHYYYATCHHESHGSIGYNGRRHADTADALKDCAEHVKTYPRHRCGIRPVDY